MDEEYDLQPVPVDGDGRERYDAAVTPGEQGDGVRLVDTYSKAAAGEVVRNDNRFGRFQGEEVPGRPFWGHVGGGPGTYRAVREAVAGEPVAVDRVTLELDEPDDRVARYDGERAVVVSDDAYQVVVDERTGDVVAVRGWENLSVKNDGTVRDWRFADACAALDGCVDVAGYLDRVGVTVEGVNEAEPGLFEKVVGRIH